MDPEHLPTFKINSLYNHLLGRQKKRLQPFIVKNPGPLHEKCMAKKSAKAKGKMKEWVDVSTDNGEDDEEEEDDNKEEEEEEDNNEEEKESDDEKSGPQTLKFGPPVGIQKDPPSSEPERPSNLSTSKLIIQKEERTKSKLAAKKSLKNGPDDRKVSFYPSYFLNIYYIQISENPDKNHQELIQICL